MNIVLAVFSPHGGREVKKALLKINSEFHVELFTSQMEALERSKQGDIDLVIVDLFGGVHSIQAFKRWAPFLLVVVVEEELYSTKSIEAASHGALEVISFSHLDEELKKALSTISALMTEPLKRGLPRDVKEVEPILIGASSGGPVSIAAILSQFSKGFTGSVVIVQHVESAYLDSLHKWLQSRSKLEVLVAKDGEEIVPGKVYLSRADVHLVLRPDRRLGYVVDPKGLYVPSIDRFFMSFGEHAKRPSIALLLSGMGDDGAKGLKMLKGRGWFTIAEDETSSAVFGMPKAAILLDAVESVLPVSKIPMALFSKMASFWQGRAR